MLLADYIEILNHFGGKLVSNEVKSFPKILIPSINHFFLISTLHLRSRQRVTTCFLNLLLEKWHHFDAATILELVNKKVQRVDLKLVGALSDLVIRELSAKQGQAPILEDWKRLSLAASAALSAEDLKTEKVEPLFKTLPPPRRPSDADPIFLAWGYLFAGFVRESQKYLRQ